MVRSSIARELRELERWRRVLIEAGADQRDARRGVPLRDPLARDRGEELFEVDRAISRLIHSGFAPCA